MVRNIVVTKRLTMRCIAKIMQKNGERIFESTCEVSEKDFGGPKRP
jgi:hypothetical protein